MKKLIPVFLVLALLFAGCSSESTSTSNESETDAASQITIYEDSIFKAVYNGISDEGVIVMNVTLENKTDTEITVLPMDSSVDDEMIQFGSGVPATIQPGKKFTQGWLIGSLPTDNVTFSMLVCDENMGELVRTDPITIEME